MDLWMSGKVLSLYTVQVSIAHTHTAWREGDITRSQSDEIRDQRSPHAQQRIEQVHEVEQQDECQEASRGQGEAQEEGANASGIGQVL